jgi:hypothetical protein
MFGGLGVAWKPWREKRREYQIQRALYKQGGGAGPPSLQANMPYGPATVTHDTDFSKLGDDE